MKDPSGKILPLAPLVASLLVRSALGAAESIAFDVAFQLAEGKLPTVQGSLLTNKHHKCVPQLLCPDAKAKLAEA